MARAKKTAAATTTVTSTAPKTRGIDLQEVEARVTALDKAKRRSYDIFDIEQRVYNLEKNSGGGGEMPQFNVLQGPVTKVADISGTVSAKDFYPGYPAANAFLPSGSWIGYSGETYWQYVMEDLHKVNLITWDTPDSSRNQIPTGYEVSYDGETFTDVTPAYVSKKILLAFTENPIKAFRILFTGDYSTSTFPMMANTTIVGE